MDYKAILSKSADALNLRIINIHSVNDDLLEVTLAHKDSLDHVDLETVSQAASVFAQAIDYEIGLDVCSEGAERMLVDHEYSMALGKHVYVELVNPKDGVDHLEGELKGVDDGSVVISVRVKHTHKDFAVEKENIRLLRLAVKL